MTPPNKIVSPVRALKLVYQDLEPAGCDTWNPLSSDSEQWHRVRLSLEVREVLKLLGTPPRDLRVIDVGCGVGRSTRLLVDLGVNPANITGIDFRATAIDYAREHHPGINYLVMETLDDWPAGEFDLCLQCTVFSSILPQLRRDTAAAMLRSTRDGGSVYWWDLRYANDFAGGDLLNPQDYFSSRRPLFTRTMSLAPTVAEAANSVARAASILRMFGRLFPIRRTHVSALYGGFYR